MSEVRFRPARPDDAVAIARMAAALSTHEGRPPPRLDAEAVRRDAFGPDAAVTAIVAEREGKVVGYAAFHPAYSTETAERGVWLADLFVDEDVRGHGIGRALLGAVATAARRGGRAWVAWRVDPENRSAQRFYRAIAAYASSGPHYILRGEALAALAQGRPSGDAGLR
jgi:GNAT superfamily N-acetyltransferase